jgi:hypothetical protein
VGQNVSDQMSYTAHRVSGLLNRSAAVISAKAVVFATNRFFRRWRLTLARRRQATGASTVRPVSTAFQGGYAAALPCTSPTLPIF